MKHLIHLEVWENHQIWPACRKMNEVSRTYVKRIEDVTCPDCKRVYYSDCPWCNGRGYFYDYEDKITCGQCDGTGYAHSRLHKEAI